MKIQDCRNGTDTRLLLGAFIGLTIATGLAGRLEAANLWQGPIDGDWFEPAHWSEGVPTHGAEVSVDSGSSILLTNATPPLAEFTLASGATLTFQGWESPLTADEMIIGGTLTHLDHLAVTETNTLGGWDTLHRIFLQGSNITIAAGAVLNGDYLGYPSTAGPGGAGGNRDGAGHAGRGSVGATGTFVGGGDEYGDPVAPYQPGSGGADINRGGYGGGAIRIVSTGHLDISGTLSVNGRNYFDTHGAGGSGGSIWLTCRTFGGAATGLVRANGGKGASQGGGGAGGRIALHYDAEPQAALAEPVPPVRFFAQAGDPGGTAWERNPFPPAMGTLYVPDRLFLTSPLEAQRLWHVRLIPGEHTVWRPDALLVDHCVVGFAEGFEMTVTNNLLLRNEAQLHLFAAPVPDPEAEDGAVLTVGGDLHLATNSWIFPYASDTNGASVKCSVGGNLTIEADSGFNADARGFRWQQGPGIEEPRFSELGSGLLIRNGSGAGHGGGGGAGWDCTGGRGYGSPATPYLPGSGCPKRYGARGGGVIRLEVTGHAHIDGTLTAAGAVGNSHSIDGSGSGGAVWLQCRTFGGAATGLITVPGGNARPNSGPGGGGRIAIHYDPVPQATLPAPEIRFSAAAGLRFSTSPIRGAEMGSLYFPDSLLAPTLIENGRILEARLEIPNFTSWTATNLTVGTGEVALGEGFRLDIVGNLTLAPGARLHLHAAPTNSPGETGAGLTVGDDLHISEDAWIYPHAEWTNGAVVEIVAGGDVTIASGGGIDADGTGWTPVSDNRNGPGAGQDNASGGGYGGRGGGPHGGAVYGSARLPLSPGSPAGWYCYSAGLRAGQGGGAIRLLAGGEMRLDGILSANAMPQEPSYGGRGASGGAILVACARMTGQGTLRANGGLNYSKAEADGGGGRIAVWIGIPLNSVRQAIASASGAGVGPLEGYHSFDGILEALPASEAAEPGSTGFFGITGTMILLR